MRKISLIGLLVVASFLITSWILNQTTSTLSLKTNTTSINQTTLPPSPGLDNHIPLGVPAIVPSIHANMSARYTKADVQAYLKKHPFPSGPAVVGASPRILSINFITAKDASEQMGESENSLGLPNASLVCYVKWKGPFTMTNVDTPVGTSPFPPIEFGAEIFDAQTGNILEWVSLSPPAKK